MAMSEHLISYCQPCGIPRRFALTIERMNHRELLDMWRQLEMMSKVYAEVLTKIVESEDARNYSI